MADEPAKYILLIFCALIGKTVCNDGFYEELFIKSLEKGNILNHFQFTTLWNSSISETETLFAMSGGLYLFYYIVDEFPREVNDNYPEMKWAAMFASFACGSEFLAGLLLLNS